MAAVKDNPFTNTRLMVAGLVVGLIGMACAMVYINKKVEERVGDEVLVFYLDRDLPAGTMLEEGFLKSARVRRQLATEASQLITREVDRSRGGTDRLAPLLKDTARINLKKGDILLASMFDKGSALQQSRDEHNRVEITLSIDTMQNPGERLGIGNIVSLDGNISYGQGVEKEVKTVTLLKGVRVRSINGNASPDFRAKQVRYITVLVSDRTATYINSMTGTVRVNIMTNDPPEAAPNEEVPMQTRREVEQYLKVKY